MGNIHPLYTLNNQGFFIAQLDHPAGGPGAFKEDLWLGGPARGHPARGVPTGYS